MPSPRIDVQLGFSVDTSQVQSQLNILKKSLSDVISINSSGLPLNNSLKQAVESAKSLQSHLNKAFNQNTGNIDLNKLQTSLAASGESLTSLSSNLLKAGNAGEQSFIALQNSITNANVKLTQSQSLVSSFATSLKNAAKWQLSSTIIHGFVGSLQTAYGYAQDLNESLNNIRIVTGYSVDKMADFASQANKAAQALNTTTTKYTDASLIFYQQGLSDKEVLERTETTIKLANVSRQSTQEVSDQLTAIWNNFADGSKSLEYYADAITALGAKTASSSKEIATGLSKFAAIGDTVGLSYEYATASLATITAQTRQSADIVGNALKTLFARIQGLKMDEKQEDGTDFNKYSKALYDVGVSVKDANGELKEMDQILDELGARWGSLSKNQQMATAQTVAGVRQYTQLIALMDNYDIFKENVATAAGSTGTLQQQADIYAESWEASRDRVRAALESIYSSLIDDKFFIGVNDSIAKIINGFDNIIESVGGFKGILLVLSNIFLTQFQGEIVSGLQNIGIKFKQLQTDVGSFFDSSKILKEDLKNSLALALDIAPTESFKQYIEGLQNINGKKEEILALNKSLSESERSILEVYLSQMAQINDEIRLLNKRTEEAQEYFSVLQTQSLNQDYAHGNIDVDEKGKAQFLLQQKLNDSTKEYLGHLSEAAGVSYKIEQELLLMFDTETDLRVLRDQGLASYKAMLTIQGQANTVLRESLSLVNNITTTSDNGNERTKQRAELLESVKNKINDIINAQVSEGNLSEKQVSFLKQRVEALSGEEQKYRELINIINQQARSYESSTQALNYEGTILERIKQMSNEEVATWSSINSQQQNSKSVLEQIDKIITEVQSRSEGMAGMFVSMVTGASSLAMSINTVRNSWKQLTSEDTGFVDKLVSGTMLLSAIVKGAGTAFQGTTTFIKLFTMATKEAAAAQEIAALKAEAEKIAQNGLEPVLKVIKDTKKDQVLIALESALASDKCTEAELAEILVQQTGITQTQAEVVAEQLLAKFKGVSTEEIKEETIAKGLEEIASKQSTSATIADAAATKLNTAEKEKNAAAQAIVNLKMLAAIAIIAAVAVGIYALVKAYNADAEAAERAAKAAQDLNKAAEETADRLDNIKSSVSAYNDAVSALHNCAKGTQEWNEALAGVQEKTAQLLKDYPELLTKANLYNKDGTLNAEVLNEEIQNKQTAADNANAAAIMGQVEAYRAKADSDLTNFSRNSRYAQYENQGQYNTYMGQDRQQAEEDVQSVVKNMDKIKMAGSTAESVLAQIGINVDVANDAQKKFANSLLETANSFIQAATAADNASTTLINSWADQQGIQLKTGQSELMAAKQSSEYNDLVESLKKTNTNNSRLSNHEDVLGSEFDNTRFAGMTISQAFNEARGTNYSLARNGILGGDENRSYAFLEDGEAKEYKFEEIKAAIASAAALDKMAESATEASSILAHIDTAAGPDKTAIAEGIKGWIANGDFADMTAADFETMKKDIGNSDVESYLVNMTGKNAAELAQIFGENYVQEFTNDLLNYETSLDGLMNSWGNEFSNITKDHLQNLGLDSIDGEFNDLTQRQKTAFAEAYRRIFEQGGSDGLEIADQLIKDSINAIGKMEITGQEKVEKMVRLADSFSSIDWSNWDEIEQLKEILTGLGINIDEQLITKLQLANHVVKDFNLDNLSEQFAKVQNIAANLKIGDTITKEAFEALEEIGMDADHFFTKMSDGTYKLTEDADAFYNTVLDIYRSELLNQIDGNKQTIEENQIASTQAKNILGTDNYGNINTDGIRQSALAPDTQLGYDPELLQKQIDLIKQLGIAEDEVIKWEQELTNTNKLSADSIGEVANKAREAAQVVDNFSIDIEVANQNLNKAQEQYLASARSIEEFDMLFGELNEKFKDGIDLEVYSNALVSIASQYENCTDEIEAYNKALKSGDINTIKAAEDNLRLATSAGEVSKKYNLTAKDVETQARLLQKSFKELSGGMEMTASQAVNLAAANQRLNRGISTLNQNLKDWKKTLTTAKTSSQDYAVALNQTYDALADLVGCMSTAEIPLDFLDTKTAEGAEHMEWLERAAQGDVEAINLLGTELAQAQVSAMEFDESLANLASRSEDMQAFLSNFDPSIEAFNNYKDIVVTGIQNLQDEIQKGNVKAGQDITELLNVNGENWVDALNSLALATGMTVDQMNTLLNKIGVSTEVNVVDTKQITKVPVYRIMYKKLDPKKVKVGYDPITQFPVYAEYDQIEHYSVIDRYEPVEQTVQVAQIKASGNNSISSTPKVTYMGTSGSGSSAGSTGGGYASPGVSSSSLPSDSGGGGGSSGGGGGSSGGGSKGSGSGDNGTSDNSETKIPEVEYDVEEGTPAEQKDRHTLYNDMVGRYHRIESALDNLARAYSRASDAADGLYGKDKIDMLTKQNKLLQGQIYLLEQNIAQSEEYLNFDKSNMESQLQTVNAAIKKIFPDAEDLQFEYSMAIDATQITLKSKDDPTYDPNDESTWYNYPATTGDISNWNEIQTAILQYVNGAEQYWGNPENFPVRFLNSEEEYDENGYLTHHTDIYGGGADDQDAWEEENLTPLTDAYALLESFVSQYDETKEKLQDEYEDVEQARKTIRAQNAEKIKLYFDYQVSMNDRDRQFLDWMSSRMSDNIYTKVEYIVTQTGNGNFDINSLTSEDMFENNRYIGDIIGNLETAEKAINTLDQSFKDNKITLDDWISGMESAGDSIMSNIDALYDYNESIQNLFADTVSSMIGDIDRYTDSIDYLISTLSHYENIAKLSQGVIDYKWEETLYEGMLETIESRYEVAEEEYAHWNERIPYVTKQLEDAEAQMLKAQQDGSTIAMSLAGQTLTAAKNAYDETVSACKNAYDEKLAMAESYLQTLQKKYVAQIKDTMSEAEREMFNGYTGDQILTQIKHMKALSEDYLDDQSKAYEINKMLRRMNSDMSKTQNKQVQSAIKNFQQETLILGQRESLSKHELEMQQKNYELLLAQMALLETSSAKTNVSLRRDAEGNYGYIYTTDMEAIDQANQNYEDKYYELFKLTKEGAEEHYEELITTQLNYLNELEEINIKWYTGQYESEEDYNRDIEECRSFYSKRITQLAEMTNADLVALENNMNIEVSSETGKFTAKAKGLHRDLRVGALKQHEELLKKMVILYSKDYNDEVKKAISDLTDIPETEISDMIQDIETNFTGLKTPIVQALNGIQGDVQTAVSNLNSTANSLDLTKVGSLGTTWVTSLSDLLTTLGGDGTTPVDGTSATAGSLGLNALVEKFGQVSNGAFGNVSKFAQSYKDAATQFADKTLGENLDAFELKIEGITSAADDLNNKLTGKSDIKGIFSDQSDILDKIQTLSDKWQTHIDKLGEVITQYGLVEQRVKKELEINVKYNYTSSGEVPKVDSPTGTITDGGGGITCAAEAAASPASTPKVFIPCADAEPPTPSPCYQQPSPCYQQCSDEVVEQIVCGIEQFQLNVPRVISISSDSVTKCQPGSNLVGDNQNSCENTSSQWTTGYILKYNRNTAHPIAMGKDPTPIDTNGCTAKNQILGWFATDWVNTANPNNLSLVQRAIDQVCDQQCYVGYDTGGYTGDWGNTEGRLALLHQKELVLNASDTENILTSVQLLRNIMSQLDLQALLTKLEMLSPLNSNNFAVQPTGSNETIQQEVKIEASFPNVTDKNEIEEALNDLVNTASQYVYRNR